MTIVSGKVYWAAIQAPNTTYEPEWGLDMLVDDNNRKAFEADGVAIKNKGDERGDFVHIRQKVSRRDGTQNDAPVVMDGQKKPFSDLVGNGSVCNVQYTPFEWEMNGKSGTSPILKKVQVVSLVEYAGGNAEDFDVIGEAAAPIADDNMNDSVPF
jgi:hypothetical protein